MFDRLGKMICEECSSRMKALHIDHGAALFRCLRCHKYLVVDVRSYIGGKGEIRTHG